ncbi:unnamed protein product [Brachionus calyciflorus]|uniref:Globin domain-containing protein n=1 Tax=Brachionus calyciflorus TaxID=104777 RepID=A0A814D996_9BILA|nr:unnamed protein product [Brachionus calyciflorus]
MGCHLTKEFDEEKLKKNPIYSVNNKTYIADAKNQLLLTENEIKLVRSSWKDLAKNGDFKKYGIEMMIKIFVNHPEIKHIWKFAAKLNTEEEMRESAQLRSHGNNVFEAINSAVNVLDKLNNTNTNLVELGKKHTLYGAKTCYFVIMRDAFMEIISESLGNNFSSEHRDAWINCFDFFISQMGKGLVE